MLVDGGQPVTNPMRPCGHSRHDLPSTSATSLSDTPSRTEPFVRHAPRREEFGRRDIEELCFDGSDRIVCGCPKTEDGPVERTSLSADIVNGRFVLIAGKPRGGSFSVVRKALDTQLGDFVAVKLVSASTDALNRKVFKNESRVLQNLSHANVVGCRDAGVDESGTYYLVMDWVERNLQEILDANGPWKSWTEFARDIAIPVVDAVAHTHLKDVEHRDIKPLNILIDDSGRPLLADFGISKLQKPAEVTTTATVADWHSKPYAPPEVVSDIKYVRDVYSLGVLMVQCLHGEALRDHPSVQRAISVAPVPPAVRAVLAKCVETQPDKRYRNASELLLALRRAHTEARTPAIAARHPVGLSLTRRAIFALTGREDARREAGAAMLADLSAEVMAHFGQDPDSGELDRSLVRVAGESWIFTLKLEDSVAVVVNAVQPEFEKLDGFRRYAHTLPSALGWTLGQPADLDGARRGIGALVEVLTRRYEQVDEQDELAAGGESPAAFDEWMRLLDARESLARGAWSPIEFDRVRTRGREAEFTLSAPHDMSLEGTLWKATDRGRQRQHGWGEVIHHDGADVTILASRVWEGLPARGALVPHLGADEVALSRQRRAVEDVKNGESVRGDLRDLLPSLAGNREPTPPAIHRWSRDLDQSKRDAVQRALGAEDFYLVQGPPGTGKTSFIAELVEQFLRARPGSRVLIASQTNVAVDNALERLESSSSVNAVRLASADPTRVDESVRHLLLETQMKRWAGDVRRNAERYMTGLADAAGVSADHLHGALALQQLVSTLSSLERLRSEADRISSSDAPSELATAVSDPSDAEALQERISALSDLRAELIADATQHLRGALTLSDQLSAAEAQTAVELLVGDSASAKTLLSRLKIQAEWLQRVASDPSLAKTFLEQVEVVAGTCIGFLRHPAARVLEFDLCIVDEASRATLTEALVPVARSRRWIVVGDTHQLPPVDEELLRNDEVMKQHDLTRELVEETLFQRLAVGLPEHSQIMLGEQYRMIRPIGDLISTCFYGGNLRSPRSDGVTGYEVAYGKPVLWLDTSPLRDSRREASPQGGGTSYANRTEARLVLQRLEVLDGAIEKGLVKKPTDPRPYDVLVLAPYIAQVAEIRQQLARLAGRLRNLAVTVMSVDAAQGREADFALFSVTRSNDKGRLGFLGQDYWRRINVALSRARCGLTIVGDADFIRGARGPLFDVLRYMKSHPDDCEVRSASQ